MALTPMHGAVAWSPGAARTRSIRIGGVDRSALLAQLVSGGIALNDAARALFTDPRFTTAPAATRIELVELSVGELGLPDGGTFDRIVEQAARSGLSLCPLEVGPHLRLQFADQPEGAAGRAESKGRAPPGSITVASAPLDVDDDTPKGFYLRRIDGVLWLRGYRSWPGHVWSAADVIVFARADRTIRAMEIRVDDLAGPEIRALLEEHLRHMHELSPPESVHALDLAGLRRPDVTFWTVWSDGRLLGCGALKELDASHGEIKSMRTASALRRRGVGRAMLSHIVAEALRRDYRRLSLETGSMEAFAPARRLYESFGFVYCAPFADYTDDPNSAFMTRTLGRG